MTEPFLRLYSSILDRAAIVLWTLSRQRGGEPKRAKATVLLGCIPGEDWRRTDEQTEYPQQMARQLLIELAGSEAAESLRDQFA